MALKSLCVFPHATFTELVAQFHKCGKDAVLRVSVDEQSSQTKYYVQAVDPNGGTDGDPLDDSHPCPGSPGC